MLKNSLCNGFYNNKRVASETRIPPLFSISQQLEVFNSIIEKGKQAINSVDKRNKKSKSAAQIL
jgi:hypothetical protein